MKILVICQYYSPEPFRISDICEELVRRGHEVRVVTGYPNYPEGILYDGFGRKKRIDEVINGIQVHRCYTFPRKGGAFKRFLNYYSYAISSTAYVCSSECIPTDGKKYDVVFCYQLSPVMMAYAAVAYKKKFKIPEVMYSLDLWPESLTAGGIKRNSFIYKYYHFVSKRLYKEPDKILVSSRMFSNYFNEKFGISKDRIEYLPQYAESFFEETSKKKEEDSFDFMFAGNIGKIQSVDTIIHAAKILKGEPVVFHIVGDGTDIVRIRNMAEGLDNVIFYGRRPVSEMPTLYAKADAMIVTLAADPALSLTLPGKIQSYMAAGKPIIGAADGETMYVIREAKCGLCGAAEDVPGFAENIRKFIRENERLSFGFHSRQYYEKNFMKNNFIDKLEVFLNERPCTPPERRS